MKSSTHQKPSSSNSHSNKRSSSTSFRGHSKVPQDRQDNNNKRNHNDSNYIPQPNNGENRQKKPKLKEYPVKNSKKHQSEISRGSNTNQRVDQRVSDVNSRPAYNPSYYERTAYVPSGSEMFYPTGRLPTGMFVNRNLNVDHSRSEEVNDNAADDETASPNASLITRSHFLLKTMPPRNKSHVAVPFLQLNPIEKSSTKESSTSEKPTNKTVAPSSTSPETSAKAITEAERDDRPSLEEIEREFQNFEKVKQELCDNEDSDPQSPSTGSREFENSIRSSSSAVLNPPVDFTSDTLPFNFQFSPARNEYNFPDPNADKNAIIFELNQSIAHLRTKKTELLQHSKNLTSQLHRILTEIEIIDIQIDQKMYKTTALRNQP